jgi:regulator of sigma E protease
VPPATYVDNFGPGSPVTLECLGIAFQVHNVVKDVEPGSSADAQGFRPGDKIDSVQFLLEGEPSEDPIPLVGWGPNGEEIDLSNWPDVHTVMNLLEDSTLRLTYERNGAIYQVVLTPEDSDRWYHPSRRLNTTSLTLVHTADSWLEAGWLGVRETQLYIEQVLTVLQRLVAVQISHKTMGGPIAITRAASGEASHGMARFFLFLALLSVNLAFLSLLPIPALDGGHILFLAIEGLRGKPVGRNVQVPFIVVSHVVFILLACMLLVPCMSQLLRLIGLIRMRKQVDEGVKVISDFAGQE